MRRGNWRRNRIGAHRRGASPTQAAVLIVIAGVIALMLGGVMRRFRVPDSPLQLSHLAPGMSLRALKKAVQRDSGTASCQAFGGSAVGFQYCVIKLARSGGDMFALLDAHGRVAAIQLFQLAGKDSLAEEAARASAAWSRVATSAAIVPHVDQGDTGATRWATRDGRWSAEMHYRARFTPDVPMMLMVADRQAIAALAAQSPADAKRHEFWDPTPEEASADLARMQGNRKSDWGALTTALTMLGDAQVAQYNAHGRYAARIADLPSFFIVGGTLLNITSASDTGWTAEARHPAFPSKSCVTYGGKVSEHPRTVEGREITSAEGIACDVPDPVALPSTIALP